MTAAVVKYLPVDRFATIPAIVERLHRKKPLLWWTDYSTL